MKKSELVSLVLKESLSLVNKEQVLQNLSILEKAGMLPPAYLKPVDDPLVPGDIPLGENIFGRQVFGRPVHEWEPE